MAKFLTLQEILNNKPVKTNLTYGLNDNVRLLSISNEIRYKDEQPIPRNTFMTFGKFDEKGNMIAQTEFSYYNPNPEDENIVKGFATQLNQMTNIAQLFAEDAIIDPFGDEYDDIDALEKDLRNSKKMTKIINKTYEQFADAIEDHIGPKSPLLRLKVVVNKNNFPQLSYDSVIAESMDIPMEETSLRMTAYDKAIRDKALSAAVAPKTADAINSAPAKDLLSSI